MQANFKATLRYLDETMIDYVLADEVLAEIMRESTLNSAAQSVIDKIKRDFDDVCSSGYQTELFREDLTLIVRVFDENLRDKLLTGSALPRFISVENDDNFFPGSNCNSVSNEADRYGQFDENGHVLPYVDFNEFNKSVEDNPAVKEALEYFERELNLLKLS
jgi:hypothetical protein